MEKILQNNYNSQLKTNLPKTIAEIVDRVKSVRLFYNESIQKPNNPNLLKNNQV